MNSNANKNASFILYHSFLLKERWKQRALLAVNVAKLVSTKRHWWWWAHAHRNPYPCVNEGVSFMHPPLRKWKTIGGCRRKFYTNRVFVLVYVKDGKKVTFPTLLRTRVGNDVMRWSYMHRHYYYYNCQLRIFIVVVESSGINFLKILHQRLLFVQTMNCSQKKKCASASRTSEGTEQNWSFVSRILLLFFLLVTRASSFNFLFVKTIFFCVFNWWKVCLSHDPISLNGFVNLSNTSSFFR